MSWCKVSSLTAAVAKSLRKLEYPASRRRILAATQGLVVEGWDLNYFLTESLKQKTYESIGAVISDLESWLERQG
jgi:hypothetical protein